MRTGHLFAGIDGIGLGLEPHGFETAWFSEYEAAPSRVLAHHYPDVPNHGDITAIDWTQVEPVDVLTGGFPCQDISKAGRGAGIKKGTRSGLWFEYVRAIRELQPRIVLIENVSALAVRGGDIVLSDLASLGFDAWWTTLRASDVGAAHRRERLFIVATDGGSLGRESGTGLRQVAPSGIGRGRLGDRSGEAPADPVLEGLPQRHGRGLSPSAGKDCGSGVATSASSEVEWGEFAPAIRRWEHVTGRPAPAPTVDGRLSADFTEWHMGFPAGWTSMLSRNERLKALGNAVVPQCADVIGRWALDLVESEVAA